MDGSRHLRRSQPPRERRIPEDPYMYLLMAVLAQAERDARDRRSKKRAREAIEFLRFLAAREVAPTRKEGTVNDDEQGYSPFFYMALLVLAIAALGMCSAGMVFVN